MNITHGHYLVRYGLTRHCKETTAYTDENIRAMTDSSMLILKLICEINNKTVVVDDKELVIEINDIKFFHNMMLVYADRNVLRYIQEYIDSIIKSHNDTVKQYQCKNPNKPIRLIDIRISTDGWGNAIVCNYDCFKVDN